MRAPHILPLTGLRLCAAVWVVVFHFQWRLFDLFPSIKPVVYPCSSIGYQAVPLFFLLSGFILSHNYFASYSLSRHHEFLFLRFARLWPVHCATLVFFVFGPDIALIKGETAWSFAEELFMVRSWYHSNLQWNGPAWSVSVEWFAYIALFPLAFLGFSRARSWPVLAALVFVFLLLQSWLPSLGLHERCHEIVFLFFAGCCLYRIYCLVRNPPAEIIVICGLLLLLGYVLFSQILPLVTLHVAFSLLIFGLAYQRGLVARLLSTKFAVYGGLASYSLYMTHALVLQSYQYYSWKRLPDALWLRFVLFLLIVAAVAGVAWAAYHYLEEPANRKLRQFALRMRLISKPATP